MNITRRPQSPKPPTTGVAQAGPSLTSLHRPGRSVPTGQGFYSEAEPGGPEKARRSYGMEDGTMRQPGESPGTFSGGSGPVWLPKRFLGSAANGGEIPRPSTILTTTTPLTNADRLRMWVRRSDRQGSGDCSRPSGWELFCRAVRIVAGVALFIAWLMLAVIALWALYGAAATPEPDCRKQWTTDARYVRHCNFNDGNGWVEAP